MTFIKQDPEILAEQDDLIMSYLNADYLSTDDLPLSPPSSTSSGSDTTGSPEKHIVDDFMLDINSTDFLSNTNLFNNPCFPQDIGGVDLLDAFPFLLPQQQQQTNYIQPIMNSACSISSLSDSEQPKKKRGRKKREPVTQNVSPLPSLLLAPKPLAPRPNMDNNSNQPIMIKSEPSFANNNNTTSNPTIAAGSTITNKKEEKSAPNEQQIDQKQVQIQKRQERLIKNRAAALLSRKRKREHLTCLEEEKETLVKENENLNQKVNDLEYRIQSLEKENLDLKQRLQLSSNPTTIVNIGQHKRPLISNNSSPKSSKATGVVFMIILFSFALFTLPSRTADRLTVGGSSILENNKKQFPLIGSSSNYDYAVEQFCQNSDDCNDYQQNNSTDLVLINSVKPHDLQSWIHHKEEEVVENNNEQSKRHIYLYSKEFSQIAPINLQNQFMTTTTDELPILSLISPYNQSTSSITPSIDDDETNEKYLQIDVQVLRSTVIRSQLLPLEQCDSASSLLDGMKKDLIMKNPHTFNVTPPLSVKREKRAIKKVARVIS